MPFAVPVSLVQVWAFTASGLGFFLFLVQTAAGRTTESGSKRDRRSQLGIIIQAIGFGFASFGPVKPILSSLSPLSIASTAVVLALTGGTIALFATSARELGKNWSLVARTRSDHELVRTGPYAHIRHPIYLGMLLFLFALAIGLGHWAQLIIALPLFLAGTAIRTRVEDGLLEQRFGDEFRHYRQSTPALIPRLF
jgi:protein-S-isoprenylcysteine O-methyltransferase Ste14